MAKYIYKLVDGEYVIYKDEKPPTNPNGVIIKTQNIFFCCCMIKHLNTRVVMLS